MTRHQKARLGLWALAAGVLMLASLDFAGRGVADEGPIGKVQQGLVGGQEVDEKTQEAYGLLTLSGSCSAALLRNDWAITAAHCVETRGPDRQPMPDPNRPGQNALRRLRGMNMTASWGGGQTKKVVRIETFRPYDVALIQLNSPFQVNGKPTGYVRGVFDDQFPYFGNPVGAIIKVFGRGINQFATANMPSSSDDKYRTATFKPTRQDQYMYWYGEGDKRMVAGGDSGGPSFAVVGTNQTTVIVGVHALTLANYVPGKPTGGWDWASETVAAADAPIQPVWNKIQEIMGPLPKVETPPEPFTGHHKAMFEENGFSTGGGKVEENILYGVQQDGQLIWHKHWIDQEGGKVRHVFAPTKKVGDGWKEGYKGAYPAGDTWMYTLSDAGELRLLRHLGAMDGSYRWREPSLVVATGWGDFKQIIPMDHGVVYQLTKLGALRWTQYWDYERGGASGVQAWMAPRNAPGFWPYLTVFSGGNGVLYGVHIDGRLMWYKHVDYKTGGNTWLGPKEVGEGWNGFTKLFSPGEGHIYGILPNGDLMYYRHTGWETGEYQWDENIKGKIAEGWNGYASAFARITTGDPEEMKQPN